MSHRLSTILSGALATVSLIMIAAGLLFAYMQHARSESPYRVINPNAHYATMMDGETLAIGREFEVLRETEFQITRELMQRSKESVVRVELPMTTVSYRPGKYNTQRIHDLPKLKPGHYELHNRICWRANLIKRECLDLPVLPVEIFSEYK